MKKLVVLFSIPLVLSACKKEESPNPQNVGWNDGRIEFPGPKAQAIIAEKWKLTDKTVEYSNGLPTETFSNVPACRRDNVLTFNSAKKYDVDETTDICPGSQPVTTYNWATSNDELSVTLDNIKWEIVSINNTTLKLRNINSSQALTVTTIETYTAQ